jgi:exonuclease VII small subunit
MADKYDPDKDYAEYLELAKGQQELEDRIAKLLEERRKLKEKADRHLEKAGQAVDFDLIKIAAHEFQVEILNEITKAVIESNNLEKAVKLIDHLETHLEARLRLAPKREDEATKKKAPPTVSPAIAARKKLQPTGEPARPEPSGPTEQAPPTPPAGAGRNIIERRTVLNDRLHEICRYEYDNDRLTRMIFLGPNGNPLRTHQLIYNKDGTLVQEIHIDRAGITLQVCDREFNKQGKIAKEIVRNPHNEVLHTVEFRYDRHARLTKKEWRDSRHRRIKSWEYRYEQDAADPSKIIWRDERNKPYGFVELRYDDKGHIIEETSKDRAGDLIRAITYQYFYG